MKRKLTHKQQRFVEEFMVDLNATQAAIRAGYSKRRASEIGYQNYRKPQIQTAIDKAREEQSRRTQITADSVLQELAFTAFLDPAGLFDKDGNLLNIYNMPEDVRRVIAGMDIYQKTTDEGSLCTTSKIKITDKLKALELLGRHFKMWTDKTEITGKEGKPLIVVGGPAKMDFDEWERKAKERLRL